MARKIINVEISHMEYPDVGIGFLDECKVKIRRALPGQLVLAVIKKKREGIITAALLEVLERAGYEITPHCQSQPFCNSCLFQTMTYDKHIEIKERMILDLFKKHSIEYESYEGIIRSPDVFGDRKSVV